MNQASRQSFDVQATTEIWLVDVDGTTARRVATYAYDGRWSPDGRQIAFFGRGDSSSTAVDNSGLVLMNADGSGRRLVVPTPGRYAGNPTWSPDGRRIAFSAEDPRQLRTDIYVVDVAGGPPTNITQLAPGQHAYYPDWRPAR